MGSHGIHVMFMVMRMGMGMAMRVGFSFGFLGYLFLFFWGFLAVNGSPRDLQSDSGDGETVEVHWTG